MLYVQGVLVILLFIIPANVLALRCGSDLIHIGDWKIEVFQKCGKPALVEKWKLETVMLKEQHEKKERSITVRKGAEFVRYEYMEE